MDGPLSGKRKQPHSNTQGATIPDSQPGPKRSCFEAAAGGAPSASNRSAAPAGRQVSKPALDFSVFNAQLSKENQKQSLPLLAAQNRANGSARGPAPSLPTFADVASFGAKEVRHYYGCGINNDQDIGESLHCIAMAMPYALRLLSIFANVAL